MDELEDQQRARPEDEAARNQKLMRSISDAILAEPGLETSGVRISVSAGYVVLEGYVAEVEHIAKVVEIASELSAFDRVKCLLFCWS